MDYDDLLLIVGHRGCYQIMFLALTFVALAFPCMQILSPTFTTIQRRLYCNLSNSSDVLVDNNDTVNCSCDKQLFIKNSMYLTVQETFYLNCNDRSNYVAFIHTVFMIGFLFGSTTYGILADKYGRKLSFVLSACNVTLCGVLAPLCHNLYLYTIFRGFTGFGSAGMLTVCYTWHTEMLHSDYRFVLSFIVKQGWTFGLFLMTLICFLSKNWIYSELMFAAPAVVFVLYYFVLVESPRWLISKKKEELANKSLHYISRFNCRSQVFHTFIMQQNCLEGGSNSEVAPSVGIRQLMKRHNLLLVGIMVWINYTVVSIAYYGLSLSWSSLSSDIFVVTLYAGAAEVVSRVIGTIAGLFLGRTLIMVAAFGTGGLSLLLMIPFYQVHYYETVVIGLALVGRCGLLMAFEFIWLYASEVFPTPIRNTAVGIGSTCARIGAVLTPLMGTLDSLHPGTHLLLYGLLSLTSAFICIFLPETRNQRQCPDSLEEGELLAKRRIGFCCLCRFFCKCPETAATSSGNSMEAVPSTDVTESEIIPLTVST